ncbi:MAG: (2Fe-2S)-binding protein [Clostridium sp.]|nr:(2Fe-2S)-binding protein [Clostridium sp.]
MNNNELSQEILDKITKVCVCKSISRLKIKEAIKSGAKTVEEVKKITGAGTGSCKGCRCIPKIQMLIDENN